MMDQLCEQLLMELDTIKDHAARKDAVRRVMALVVQTTVENGRCWTEDCTPPSGSPSIAPTDRGPTQGKLQGLGALKQPMSSARPGEQNPPQVSIQILEEIGKIWV